MSTEPEQIRSRIEETRHDLSTDVNALTEKVSPSRVMARQVGHIRHTLNTAKDAIMGTADSTTTTVGQAAGSATERVSSMAASATDTIAEAPRTVRQQTRGNPLAAGLIAFGAGWLIASLLPTTRQEEQLAEQANDRIREQLRPAAQQVRQAVSEVADNLREPAQHAVDSVKSTADDATTTVTQEGRAAAGHVSERTEQARQNLGQHTN